MTVMISIKNIRLRKPSSKANPTLAPAPTGFHSLLLVSVLVRIGGPNLVEVIDPPPPFIAKPLLPVVLVLLVLVPVVMELPAVKPVVKLLLAVVVILECSNPSLDTSSTSPFPPPLPRLHAMPRRASSSSSVPYTVVCERCQGERGEDQSI